MNRTVIALVVTFILGFAVLIALLPSERAQAQFPRFPNIPRNIPVFPGGRQAPANNQNPQDLIDLGQKGLDLVQMSDPARQEELAQSIALAISNRYPMCRDQKLNDYVTLVGLSVAAASPKPDLDYAFGILETNEIGAYSAPFGYVFITRGALNLMQDESELAGVLAHEIGHVVKNHGIEAVKSAKLKAVTDAGMSKFGGKFAAFSGYADAGTDFLLVKGYSQQQEREADTEAINYLVLANYDPRGFVRFLDRMDRFTHDPSGFRAAMSTHPGTRERISNCSRQIASLAHIGGVTLKDRFDANVTKTQLPPLPVQQPPQQQPPPQNPPQDKPSLPFVPRGFFH
jgi:predicted Zn-dependent protease